MVTIELEPELERWVRDQVSQGHFASFAEAVNAAMKNGVDNAAPTETWKEGDPPRQITEGPELRARIAEGLAQADRGEFVDFDMQAFARRKQEEWRR